MKQVTVYVENTANASFQLDAISADAVLQFARELERERRQRIEQRAGELYAVSCTLPQSLAEMHPRHWKVFAEAAARCLGDRDEELEALELYHTMQDHVARL
jgi:hypothetical protein